MRLPHIKPDHCDDITPLTPPVDRVATALHKINMPNISYRDMSFPDIPMDPIVDLTYFDIDPKNINNITNVYFLDSPAIVDLMEYEEFLDVLSRLDALEASISDISDSISDIYNRISNINSSITNIDNSITNIYRSINHITNTYIQDPDKGGSGSGRHWVNVVEDVYTDNSPKVYKRTRKALVAGSSGEASAFITPVKYDDYLENDT